MFFLLPVCDSSALIGLARPRGPFPTAEFFATVSCKQHLALFWWLCTSRFWLCPPVGCALQLPVGCLPPCVCLAVGAHCICPGQNYLAPPPVFSFLLMLCWFCLPHWILFWPFTKWHQCLLHPLLISCPLPSAWGTAAASLLPPSRFCSVLHAPSEFVVSLLLMHRSFWCLIVYCLV